MIKNSTLHYSSESDIIRFQEERLKETLEYILHHSPFYKRIFKENNIDIRQIKHLSDLHKLPVTTKEDLQQRNNEFICIDKESIIQLVGSSMEYANMVVYEKSKESKELEGMGTTLEICLIYNNRAFIGHVGDSRIYRIRKEFMRKLTQDHSYVQKLVKDGTITQEEAVHHPQKPVRSPERPGQSGFRPGRAKIRSPCRGRKYPSSQNQ